MSQSQINHVCKSGSRTLEIIPDPPGISRFKVFLYLIGPWWCHMVSYNLINIGTIRMLCDYMIWSAKHRRDVSGCCSAYRLASASHYSDVIMGAMASQITSLTIVYSSVYSGADQRKHQSSASVAFVRGIHRWPVNSLHKRPVTRKIFPFDDVIMSYICKISKQQ